MTSSLLANILILIDRTNRIQVLLFNNCLPPRCPPTNQSTNLKLLNYSRLQIYIENIYQRVEEREREREREKEEVRIIHLWTNKHCQKQKTKPKMLHVAQVYLIFATINIPLSCKIGQLNKCLSLFFFLTNFISPQFQTQHRWHRYWNGEPSLSSVTI